MTVHSRIEKPRTKLSIERIPSLGASGVWRGRLVWTRPSSWATS